MKTTLMLTAVLLLTTSALAQEPAYFSGYASHQQTNLDRAVTRYLECLESPNDGVVESGLAHIGRMKLYYPERRFPEIEKTVGLLATYGRTPALRYRAYLIGTLFTNPSAFSTEARSDFRSPDELFSAIAMKLQQTLLGAEAGGQQ
jgi:hypothetical protein